MAWTMVVLKGVGLVVMGMLALGFLALLLMLGWGFSLVKRPEHRASTVRPLPGIRVRWLGRRHG